MYGTQDGVYTAYGVNSCETNQTQSLGCNESWKPCVYPFADSEQHFQDEPSVVDGGASQWGTYYSITSLSCTKTYSGPHLQTTECRQHFQHEALAVSKGLRSYITE